jgi:hypothetical protein
VDLTNTIKPTRLSEVPLVLRHMGAPAGFQQRGHFGDGGTIRVGSSEAPFAVTDLPAGEDLEPCIFIDKYLVEVFANGRQALDAAHLKHVDRRAMDAFTVGAPTTPKKVEIWKLKPTNEGFREAQKNRLWLPDEGK